jgi:hypothetical protein
MARRGDPPIDAIVLADLGDAVEQAKQIRMGLLG